MFTFLSGHRTYLIALAAAGVMFLQVTNHMSAQDAEKVFELLGIGAVASLRSAISAGRSK